VTFAPQTLKDLAALWVSEGGVNSGIVGDAPHVLGGTSYHLGLHQLLPSAYSRQLARDKAGLTDAASAIDLGRLDGSLGNLQKFSVWLVAAVRANQTKYRDVREVIYSPDGVKVLRWDNELKALRIGGDGTGQGDNSHRWHTHISFYRDSEFRDKRDLFAPYFVKEDPMGLAVRLLATVGDKPLSAFGTAKVKGAAHSIVRVSDGKFVPVADGLDLGTVQLAVLTKPLDANAGDRTNVVAFNASGEQHVALRSDVAFVLLPAPVTDCTPAIKSAVNAGVDALGAEVVAAVQAAVAARKIA
jgi:hypothetical protein